MLNGVLKGDLSLNKNVNKYLDMCLKCNACSDFCPSGIDARKIFLTAKAQYFQNCPSSNLVKAFQSKFVFNLVLNSAKIASNTYRILQIDKLTKVFYPIFLKMGELGKKIILANEFLSINVVGQVCPTHYNPESRPVRIPRQQRVVYFEGCVNNYINPQTKNAVENILKKMGVTILSPNSPFECCGVPFLSSGNTEQFVKQAEYNLSKIPDDIDYFLTDCASCQNAFFEYENYINDEKLLKKLKMINEKSINAVDFIVKNAKSFEFSQKVSFTFHKPCHLENMNFLNDFLEKSKNVEYIEMKNFDECCGFSGEFALKNREISQAVSAKKITNAYATKADYILTSCPSCFLGLIQGAVEKNILSARHNLICSFVEFIMSAEIRT